MNNITRLTPALLTLRARALLTSACGNTETGAPPPPPPLPLAATTGHPT